MMKRKQLIIVGVVAAVAIALVWAVVSSGLTGQIGNKARDVAKPMEDALAKAGGTQRCVLGDNGYLSDNTAPWYHVYYELPQGREQAKQTVINIAKDNGFSLKQATLDDRSAFIGIDDKYIDDWLIVPAPKDGVSFRAMVYNGGKLDLGCNLNNVTVTGNDKQSVVRLNVGLPNVR